MTFRPKESRWGRAKGGLPSRPPLTAVLVAGMACAVALAGLSGCSRGPDRVIGSAPPPTVLTSTGPPPLTVLTRDTGEANGDIFIAPAGGSYPAGPEIVTTTGKVVWFHRLPAGEVATDFRTQTYLGQPVLTWFQSGSQGATRAQEAPVASRPGRPQRHRLHLQRPLPADRHGPGGQWGHDQLPRVPHHALEHRADHGRHGDDREPHLHRRPRRPAGHRRHRPGGRHQDRPGAVPVGQRRPRPLRRQLRGRGRPPRARPGTGSTSTPSTSTPTATCW